MNTSMLNISANYNDYRRFSICHCNRKYFSCIFLRNNYWQLFKHYRENTASIFRESKPFRIPMWNSHNNVNRIASVEMKRLDLVSINMRHS